MCIRDRFGRVDRRGVLSSAANYAESVVMLRGERAPVDDPIYGSAMAETWSWLCGLDPVDFGLERLPEPPERCVAGKPDAPLLSPLHLRSFAHTWPTPSPDHVVARWLHGDQRTSPAVSLVWRDELIDQLPEDSGAEPRACLLYTSDPARQRTVEVSVGAGSIKKKQQTRL